MSRRLEHSPAPSPDHSRSVRHRVLIALLVVTIVVLVFRARGILASSARYQARLQINAGAITQAQQWLAWSSWFDPSDGTTDLLRAACFRHRTQAQRWSEAIRSAQQKGASVRQVQQEIDTSSIRAGRWREGTEQQHVRASMVLGAPDDVVAAFVYGYLRREQTDQARIWLDAFAATCPDEGRVAYLRGIVQRTLGDREGALVEFEKTLAKYPGHEQARGACAEIAEEQDLLRQALEHYVQMATHAPTCEDAQVGMARVLRKLGRLEDAQAILGPLVVSPSLSPEVALQMGHTELELGRYAAAKGWFERVDATAARYPEAMSAALMPVEDEPSTVFADQLFAAVEASDHRQPRMDTLKNRLTLDAHDSEAIQELSQLVASSSATKGIVPHRPAGTTSTGPDLYAIYCGACHGKNGDGNGLAGRHLFPRPRNLRTKAAFRLVSTVNGVPTRDDVEAVIRRGVPGTSMPAFSFLSPHQRTLLADMFCN